MPTVPGQKIIDATRPVELSAPDLALRKESSVCITNRRDWATVCITNRRLAKDISVPPRRINEIVHGKRAISADTALRLARFFATTDRFWINLQTRYDLEVEKDRLGEKLETEVQVFDRAARESEFALDH